MNVCMALDFDSSLHTIAGSNSARLPQKSRGELCCCCLNELECRNLSGRNASCGGLPVLFGQDAAVEAGTVGAVGLLTEIAGSTRERAEASGRRIARQPRPEFTNHQKPGRIGPYFRD